MTSAVNELETFVAALRLSFLTSSSTACYSENLRGSIEEFRETLRSRSGLATSPSPTELSAQKGDAGHLSGLGAFPRTEESISATSTVWSDDGRIGVASQLTKQIELINIEVRQSANQICELVQGMTELKSEIRALRSALVPVVPAANSEGHALPGTLCQPAVQDSPSLVLVRETKADPSLKERSRPSNPRRSTAADPRSLPQVPPNTSASNSIVTPLSFVSLEPPLVSVFRNQVKDDTYVLRKYDAFKAAKPSSPPYRPFQTPPPAPCAATVLRASVYARTATAGDLTRSSSPAPPVSTTVPVSVPPRGEDLESATSSGKPQELKGQPESRPAATNRVGKGTKFRPYVPDGQGKGKGKDIGDSKSSQATGSHLESPVIATILTTYYDAGIEGEITVKEGDKVTLLNSQDAPLGWTYGETIQTRKGIFLARHVRQRSGPETNTPPNLDDGSGNSEVRERSLEPRVIATALYSTTPGSGQLRLCSGDEIEILDSPNTPVGWMYGQIVKRRRGIFPSPLIANAYSPRLIISFRNLIQGTQVSPSSDRLPPSTKAEDHQLIPRRTYLQNRGYKPKDQENIYQLIPSCVTLYGKQPLELSQSVPMTDGVDELEAFVAALRLSFLTSSTAPGSSEDLRQGIAAFRESLRPRAPFASDTTPTRADADADTQKEDNVYTSGSNKFPLAGEPISSSSTSWSGDDKIDVIETVNTEVREGTSQSCELIKSVNELRTEVHDLRSALVAFKPVAVNEDPTPALTSSKTEVRNHANPPQVYESQAQAFSKKSSSVASRSTTLSAATGPQSFSTVTASHSTPDSAVAFGPFSALTSSSAVNFPPLPLAPLQFQSAAPSLAANVGPTYPQITVPVDPVCPSRLPSPATVGVPESVSSTPNNLQLASSTDGQKDSMGQPETGSAGGTGHAKAPESTADAATDGSTLKVEDVKNNESAGATESLPKAPVTAFAISFHYTSNKGEMSIQPGDKITILDFPDTPEGWMYGENPKRDGGFSQEISHQDAQKLLNDNEGLDNAEVKVPGPESAVIMVSVAS
ncbi:hypothetical protein FRC01_001021, partial [Tulasnella sp. 417]